MGVRCVIVVFSYLGALEERDLLEDLAIDRSLMVKWVFKQQDGNAWIEFL
jgi:hypothetical protein